MILGVRRAVDGKDYIYVAMRLNEWMERNVLKIFSSINKRKASFLSDSRSRIVIAIERIRLVFGNIVVVVVG